MYVQVNLFQKHSFLRQLTHNMTKDCSLNHQFSTWKFQAQNMSSTFVYINCSECKNKNTICVQGMFLTCSELGIFMYWTRNSMNNLSSYCGLVEAKIRASGENLPVCTYVWTKFWTTRNWTRDGQWLNAKLYSYN